MRVNTVGKCRKSPGKCGKCGVVIKAGDKYRWAAGRFTGKKVRCDKLKCQLRPSDLTGSDKLSRLYSAREDLEDFIGTDFESADEVKDAIQAAADEAREVASEYEEAVSALDGRLNSDELQDKADQCNAWADELDNVDVEEFEPNPDDKDDEEKEATKSAWQELIIGNVEDALSSLEL